MLFGLPDDAAEREPRHVLPSDVASRRLAGNVAREVDDLRARVEEGMLRSEFLLTHGRADAAAEVLAEQQRLLATFAGRVVHQIAAASAEAEAEAVLAAVPGVDALHEPRASGPQRPRWRERVGAGRDRLQGVLASVAAAAAAAGFVALGVAAPTGPQVAVDAGGAATNGSAAVDAEAGAATDATADATPTRADATAHQTPRAAAADASPLMRELHWIARVPRPGGAQVDPTTAPDDEDGADDPGDLLGLLEGGSVFATAEQAADTAAQAVDDASGGDLDGRTAESSPEAAPADGAQGARDAGPDVGGPTPTP